MKVFSGLCREIIHMYEVTNEWKGSNVLIVDPKDAERMEEFLDRLYKAVEMFEAVYAHLTERTKTLKEVQSAYKKLGKKDDAERVEGKLDELEYILNIIDEDEDFDNLKSYYEYFFKNF